MNYYFLVEDEKSLIKVLPKWLEHLCFPCTRVADITYVNENNYILQSGHGVTQLITKELFNTIDTIIGSTKRIDNLVVILDTEDLTVQQRKEQVMEKINEHYKDSVLDFEINLFVCNHCFESWLLGKPDLYPSSVDEKSDFYNYYIHYNIEQEDPEKMPIPAGCTDTIAKYHFHYLCELFRYKRIRYTKKKPDLVSDLDYFNGLLKRIKDTDDIRSFKEFICFIISQNERVLP